MTHAGKHHRVRLRHVAWFYADDEEYLEGVVPFVHEGLEAGEPVLVGVPGHRLELLRGVLEPAENLTLLDMEVAGRNPGVHVPFARQFVAGYPDQPTRIVGEPIHSGRSEDEYSACVQSEALMNLALAEAPLTVLCPYHRALPPRFLDEAAVTHPILLADGQVYDSPDYADPRATVAAHNRPLPEPGGVGATLIFDHRSGTREVRRFVGEHAGKVGLGEERIADLCTAATEVATNTMVHTGQPGILTVWSDDDAVHCEVEDSGRLSDPLAGRAPPGAYDGAGHGLFLVNTLSDLVRTYTRPDGTTIRMTFALPHA